MPRVRFAVRGMIVAVAAFDVLLLLERSLFDVALRALP
jgi:hypothetical protein